MRRYVIAVAALLALAAIHMIASVGSTRGGKAAGVRAELASAAERDSVNP